MRSIGEIKSEEQAKRFGDYLLANNIPCDIEDEEDGTWSIWIHDDDQIEKAEAELKKFTREPKDSRYKNAEAKADITFTIKAASEGLGAKRAKNRAIIIKRGAPGG